MTRWNLERLGTDFWGGSGIVFSFFFVVAGVAVDGGFWICFLSF